MRRSESRTAEPDHDHWIDDWHRGRIHAPRAAGESAAAWQEKLFDDLVSRDPLAAFGQGALQSVLWQLRIDLATQYGGGGRPILDVGSGNGLVPQAVAERTGSRVLGIDVSGACVRYAAEHFAHPAVEYRHAAIEDLEPDTEFGLVTMYEVIEHVDDPVGVLRRVRDWLDPGGYVILSTPNRSSLNRRIKALPGVRTLYTRLSGRSVEGAQAGHVEEYRCEELKGFVRAAGLELVRTRGVVLLLPFPAAIGPLARSHRFASLNARSGDWYPRLASHVYLIARRPA
jgi:2-polyprenyl-3-methyl-5-hydroxy-6-metoxy-1,4-benzoquinol methylase